jgi:UDP-N-acetylmuramyl pentapeptide phosphotransferase/UDP-N-acetylglucosamine-1-phosphate transferase
LGFLLASSLVSFFFALFFVWQAHQGATWGHDSDLDSPQKFHSRSVPRMGGVGIFAGLVACVFGARLLENPFTRELATLVVCSMPAVAFGLAEDITGRVSSFKRLLAAACSAALGAFMLQAVINRVDIAPLDAILVWTAFSIPLTIFAVSGISNAVNIIDGFNGLASMVSLMMFAAIAYVAHVVGDRFIVIAALSCIGAILGFFIWNFPLGLIFLGDGGAYLLGFMLAELAILLFHRHPEVSPWFGVLVFFYPTVETAFSIYRRRVIKGVPVDTPDATHLHSLIFRRLMRSTIATHSAYARNHQNAMTSPYLWVLSSIAVVPATLFWNNTPALIGFCALFLGMYLWIYQRIVRFRTPLWLRRR